MTQYRRRRFKGGYYFFTVVTYRRQRFLTDEFCRICLRENMNIIRDKRPFDVVAICLLPDHLHCIWRLPDGDNDYSTRWRLIKKGFTRQYLAHARCEADRSDSRIHKGERGVWQRRFWEHQLRDEHDLQNHVNYTHYNPVRHGCAKKVEEWLWSSYHEYKHKDHYNSPDWGATAGLILPGGYE